MKPAAKVGSDFSLNCKPRVRGHNLFDVGRIEKVKARSVDIGLDTCCQQRDLGLHEDRNAVRGVQGDGGPDPPDLV